MLPAGAFIPVVEQSVLMRLVDRRALELAVQAQPGPRRRLGQVLVDLGLVTDDIIAKAERLWSRPRQDDTARDRPRAA